MIAGRRRGNDGPFSVVPRFELIGAVIPGRPQAGTGTYEHRPPANGFGRRRVIAKKPVCLGSGLAAAQRPGMTFVDVLAIHARVSN